MDYFAPLIAFAIAAISASSLVDGAWTRRLSTLGGWILAAATTVLAASSVTVVPAGHVKVQELFGNVTATPIVGTPSIVNPFSQLHTFNIQRTQLHYPGLDGFTLVTPSGNESGIDVTVTYKLNPAATPLLYREIGRQDAVSTFLDDTVRIELQRALTFAEPATGGDSEALADSLKGRLNDRLFEEMVLLGYNEAISGPAFMITSVAVLPSSETVQLGCELANKSL